MLTDISYIWLLRIISHRSCYPVSLPIISEWINDKDESCSQTKKCNTQNAWILSGKWNIPGWFFSSTDFHKDGCCRPKFSCSLTSSSFIPRSLNWKINKNETGETSKTRWQLKIKPLRWFHYHQFEHSIYFANLKQELFSCSIWIYL